MYKKKKSSASTVYTSVVLFRHQADFLLLTYKVLLT